MTLINQVYGSFKWKKTDDYCASKLGISLQKLFLHLKIPVVFLGREQCDLSQEQSILQNLKEYQPQIILNTFSNIFRIDMQHGII